LILSEHQNLFWDAASRSTKRQDMLEILEGHGPIGSPADAYGRIIYLIFS